MVFDSELAKKYLEICEGLGVEINLSKSIVSKNKPVFEFAKRTVVGYDNLSAISLRALTSAVSLQARVSNALAWIKNGLISSPSLLLAMISKYPFKTTKSSSIMGALSLLGVLASQKLIQPRKVVECMVNPLDEDFDLEEAKLELPLHSILKQVIEIGKNSGSDPVDLNLPKPDPREEYVDEWEPQFVATILQIALAKAKGLEEH